MMKNKARDAKECTSNLDSSQRSWKNHYASPIISMTTFKQSGKSLERFTPLNPGREKIW